MGKICRHGQAEILSARDIQKIKRALVSPSHQLMFAIALHTAERWGAIRQLKVEDVYADPVRSVPHKLVTFRASTRKAAPDGSRATRQVFVNGDLAFSLRAYRPPTRGYLFPSPQKEGPVSPQAVDQFLREWV
ncbi:MAG: hypothetical protein MUD14_10065 [Hydrococcus sp. Prado102]|jgi:integrase/recombinase XerD|nr:hypothetical protein [Hydrococcus sp. Prado102]